MLPLHTERTIIRMMRAADSAALVGYRNDPAIGAFQDWEMPFTEEAARRLIDGQTDLDGPTPGQWVQLAIESNGTVVGDVAVYLSPDAGTATFGYTLAAQHHGAGFATEALGAIVDAVFAAGAHRAVATLDPENVASARVLERVGFTFECLARSSVLVRGEWADDLRYAMLADERVAWTQRPSTPPDTVALVPLTVDNEREYYRLKTHHSQQRFVATMAESFTDALFPEVYNGAPVVPRMFGIEADGIAVGFMMIADVTDHHPDPYLWRLLIDRTHQRRGIGEWAMAELIAALRARGCTRLTTSWELGHGTPEPFYLRLGFLPTGEIEDGETVGALSL